MVATGVTQEGSITDSLTAGTPGGSNQWQHPPSFYCPISQQCMHDPVVLSDGHSYERRHIERWLRRQGLSPVTGMQLPTKDIFPNHALRNAIEEYFQQVFSVHRREIRRSIGAAAAPAGGPRGLGTNAPFLRTIDALMQCSLLMNADLSTEQVLRHIMEEAKALVGAEVASAFLVDHARAELFSTVNSTGSEIRIPLAVGIAGHVAASAEPVVVPDAYADARFDRSVDVRTGFKTRDMMCVPLTVRKGGVIGVVQLINKTSAGVLCGCSGGGGGSGGSGDQSPVSSSPVGAAVAASHGDEDAASLGQSFTAEDLHFLQVFASQAANAIVQSGALDESQPTVSREASSFVRGSPADDGGWCPSFAEGCLSPCFAGRRKGSGGSSAEGQSPSSPSSPAALSGGKGGCPATALGKGGHPAPVVAVAGDAAGTTRADREQPRAIVRSISAGEPRPRRPCRRLGCLSADALVPCAARATGQVEILDEAFRSWHFDALEFAEVCNAPLNRLFTFLCHELHFAPRLGVDPARLAGFAREVENGYRGSNQYHNNMHATSVLHSMHALLELGGVASLVAPALGGGETGADITRLACLLAAAVHDFDHLGLSNDFLVRTGHERAIRYNDEHVNEHHHVAAAFALLRRPENDFLSSLPQSSFRQLRCLAIKLVLSTDMADNNRLLSDFTALVAERSPAPPEGGNGGGVESRGGEVSEVSEGFAPADAGGATLVLQMAMKCADLGHLSMDWDLHVKWTHRLEAEFFAQGDQEKALGLPVSNFMDRALPGPSKTQVGFFDFVVFPLLRSFVRAAPGAEHVLRASSANYEEWKSLEEDRDTAEEEEADPTEGS